MPVYTKDTGQIWSGAGGAAWTTVSGIQPLTITTTSPLVVGTVGIPYATTMTASGGVPPYAWSLVSSTGNNSWVVTSFGSVTGTPLTAETDSLTIRVTDSALTSTTGVFGITVNVNIYSWQNLTPKTFTLGTPDYWDFSPAVPSGGGVITSIGTDIITPFTLDVINKRIIYDGTGIVGTTNNYQLRSSVASQQDWVARSTAPGVVWYNNFDTDAEVNAYRWSSQAQPGGNDPLAATADAQYMRRVATGGPGGAPYLHLETPNGTLQPDVSWWRPFSAMAAGTGGTTGAALGNGKLVADAGAIGTSLVKPIRVWQPTQTGNQTQHWNQDYYGPATYPNSTFYLQMRVQSDPRRFTTPYTNVTNVGKKFYITITDRTLVCQEIVTYQGSVAHHMYVCGSPPIEQQQYGTSLPGYQLNSSLANYGLSQYCGVSGNNYCWQFATDGTWDTLLYVVTAGPETSGNVHSIIQVYAAHESETQYTKIWDEVFTHQWETGYPQGRNAIVFNMYWNIGTTGPMPGPFWQRWAQLIFSTQWIPCPNSSSSTFPRLAGWFQGQDGHGSLLTPSANLNKAARMDVVILQGYPGWRDTGTGVDTTGRTNALRAANPDMVVLQYVMNEVTQCTYSTVNPPVLSPLPQVNYEQGAAAIANRWFAYANGITHTTVTTSFFSASMPEMNYTAACEVDGSGRNWVQWMADWVLGIYKNGASAQGSSTGPTYTQSVNPTLSGFMLDNNFVYARTSADFNRDGVLDTPAINAPYAAQTRAGIKQFYDRMKGLWPAGLLVGNVDWVNAYKSGGLNLADGDFSSLTEYYQQFHGSLLEAHMGNSVSSVEQWNGFKGVIRTYIGAMNAALPPKLVQLHVCFPLSGSTRNTTNSHRSEIAG